MNPYRNRLKEWNIFLILSILFMIYVIFLATFSLKWFFSEQQKAKAFIWQNTLIKTIWNIINHSRRVKSLLWNCSFWCEWVDRVNLLFSMFPLRCAGEKKYDEKLLSTTFLIVFLRTWKTYVQICIPVFSYVIWFWKLFFKDAFKLGTSIKDEWVWRCSRNNKEHRNFLGMF